MIKAIIIADIGYGDTGKGTITDYLSRQSEKVIIVRYNGGPQAAHNVVEENRHHVFSQFGSGTLVPGVKTHLSKHVMVNPINLFNENDGLREIGISDAISRLTVDERCLVITPFHKAANRIREMARGKNRHGSCGEGVSECVTDYLKGNCLRVDDLFSPAQLKDKLIKMQKAKREQIDDLVKSLEVNEETEYEIGLLEKEFVIDIIIGYYARFINEVKIVGENYLKRELDACTLAIFEGAQGVLLDPDIGFFPYVTHSDITPSLAFDLLGDMGEKAVVLGTTRIYTTRHGPGPFVSESDNVKVQPFEHNELSRWQGPFRIGYLDTVAARYAIKNMGRVDYLAVTCLDRMKDMNPVGMCNAYTRSEIESDYFECTSDDKIVGLKKQANRNNQALLTKRLEDCKMVFTPVDPNRYIQVMESELEVPVAIISKGMMARHKMMIKTMW